MRLTNFNKWITRLSMVAACFSAAQGAEKIRYEEIPTSLGTTLEHRGIKVVTLDGKEHEGRGLTYTPSRLSVIRGKHAESMPSDQISRIEISQGGRFFHHIVKSAKIPLWLPLGFCGWDERSDMRCDIVATAVFSPVVAACSPVWAYTAAMAPFYLIADGIAWLIPPKVFEIVR